MIVVQACVHNRLGRRDRMTKRIALCAVMLLAGLGMAQADTLDPIAVRQAGFSLQNGDFAFIRSVVKDKGDVKPLEGPAKAIAMWTKLIPTLFPKVHIGAARRGGDGLQPRLVQMGFYQRSRFILDHTSALICRQGDQIALGGPDAVFLASGSLYLMVL